MLNILDEIVAHKRHEVEQQKSSAPRIILEKNIHAGNGSFLPAIQKLEINIIAEIKPKSPSGGILCSEFSIAHVMEGYNKYACAISVLTDEKYFGGSPQLLHEVVLRTHAPVLYKDFIIDPYQCFLARSMGAQAVLLIVKILTDAELILLFNLIKELGMTAVLEIQNVAEFERIKDLGAEVVLINNRNLEDFTINFNTTKQLAPQVSQMAKVVSASGIQSKKDIEELLPYCSNFLIGSSLMRSTDVEVMLSDLCKSPLTATLANLSINKGNRAN